MPELFAILYMTLSTWGLLPKSQVDAETIEQAIVRIVAQHNDDAEAHSGTGQAIALHRENDIVDHKAGSILADKLTMRELSIMDDFRTLAHWQTTGEVSNTNWPALSLYIESGAVEKSEIFKQAGLPSQWVDFSKDMLFQVLARFDFSNNNYTAWFGSGLNSATPTDGLGFVVENGQLFAVLDLGTTTTFEEIPSVSLGVDNIYRVQYTAGTLTAEYYVNNALVATIERPDTSGGVDLMARIGVQTDGITDGNLIVGGLYCARGI